MNDSGVNVLLNIFFGPTVNAARAVSYQVSSAVNSFIVNFFTAVRPQLMKSYANGDRESLIKLFFNIPNSHSCCFGYYAFLFFFL